MPSVLAVAAVGKTDSYPPESYHATQVWGAPTPEGYFSAAFTCHGPEVDVCAPGVANQPGRVGDEIRVTNSMSKKSLIGRVLDAQSVEVVQ